MNGSGGYDYLMGSNGNDRLYGNVGSDKLIGGAGNDQFYFNTALNATTNRDTVIDYNVVQDSLRLENAIFSKLAVAAHLSSAYFRAASHALDRNDYIVYDRATGSLFYDPNGNGAGGQVMFALFSNKPVLTASRVRRLLIGETCSRPQAGVRASGSPRCGRAMDAGRQ